MNTEEWGGIHPARRFQPALAGRTRTLHRDAILNRQKAKVKAQKAKGKSGLVP
jgi:hypothetical protein